MRSPQHLVSSRMTDDNTKWYTLAAACIVLAAAAVLSWFLIQDKHVVGAREEQPAPATRQQPALAAETGD